jgi:hypothetical protein
MHRTVRLSFLLLSLLAAVATAASELPLQVVVIGWDGANRDRMQELLAQNQLTNLAALARDGRLVEIEVTTGATETKAGWAQVLTGYAPEHSRVYSNHRFEPIPEGYTVFERLEAHFGATNIDTVAIAGKSHNLETDSGGPYSLTAPHVDLFENGVGMNDRVAKRVVAELEKRKGRRLFLFVHLLRPDADGHTYGESSKQYLEGIRSDDAASGEIIRKIKDLGQYDRTLIYITCDHGFDKGMFGHSAAPHIFLATNDKLVNRNGDRMDVTPTVLKRFGVALDKITPPLDGTPLDEPEKRATSK